jgi:isopenicillin N synthase-like dioxygenase
MLKSTLHRVTLPPLQDRFTGDDRMTRARYSIPYFVSPEGPSIIKCLSSCADAEHPPKYGPIVWQEYMMMRASMQYESKGS